jgi:hypothetical protein
MPAAATSDHIGGAKRSIVRLSAIGSATIKADATTDQWRSASFFAQEYEWKGNKVISFRGTDKVGEDVLMREHNLQPRHLRVPTMVDRDSDRRRIAFR